MTFISYAQNYEDVILWRALRDVERGFYVDVGAADPQVDSVTVRLLRTWLVGHQHRAAGRIFCQADPGQTA